MATIGAAAFSSWDVWRRGSWPFGDWLTVPLTLIAQVNAIDMVYQTTTYMNTKGADWSKLSNAQLELAQWLNE